ncbi:MAG: DUF3592 domain-containing protein [Candidatus Zixiibacteriota bacterium]
MTVYLILIVITSIVMLGFVGYALVRNRRARRPVVGICVGLFIVGSVAGFYQANHLSNLRAMREWPTVAGTVIESRLAGQKAIVPHVVYSYDVNSQPFVGISDLGTPAFGNASKRLNEAETLLADYPVGKEVTVHYDALDPKSSYIVSAVPWNAYAQMGLWIFLILSSLAAVVLYGFAKRTAPILPT